MDYRKEFERMMQTQTAMALATAADGAPNVRIVNFYYDAETKALYFSTFSDNQKVAGLRKILMLHSQRFRKVEKNTFGSGMGLFGKALFRWKPSRISFY